MGINMTLHHIYIYIYMCVYIHIHIIDFIYTEIFLFVWYIMIVSYKSYTSTYIKSSTINLMIAIVITMMKVVLFLLIEEYIHHFNSVDEYVHDLKLYMYISTYMKT